MKFNILSSIISSQATVIAVNSVLTSPTHPRLAVLIQTLKFVAVGKDARVPCANAGGCLLLIP